MKEFLRLSRTARVLVCILVAGPFAVAATQQSKPPAKVALIAPTNSAPIFVTPSYMRMKHASFIINLAAQVQGGKAPLSDLASFVGPEIAQTLVSANLKPLQAKLSPTSGPGSSSPPTHVDYGVVTSSSGAPIATLPSSAYSPHSINHSDLRVGQTTTAVLVFTNMYQGSITARFDDTFSGSASISMIATYTGTEQPNTSGGMEPVVDQYVSNAGPITAAPGQDCRAFVHFKFSKAGKFKCNLIVNCNGATPWSVSVPVEMTVTEMGKTNVIAYSDKGLIDVDSIGLNHDLPITIETTAYKSPFTVTISPKSLPNGISADSISVNVNHAGKTQATIKVKGGPAGLETEAGLPKANEMVFTVAAGDATKSTMKTLVCCLLGRVEYDYPDQQSGGSTWSQPFLQMAADGSFFLGGSGFSQSYILQETPVVFGVAYASGVSSGNGFGDFVQPSPGANMAWQNSGQSTWIKANWQTCLHQGPAALFWEDSASDSNISATLSLTGNQSHPSTFSFPSSPPYVITMWW